MIKKVFPHLFFLLLITVFTVWISYLLYIWTGYPRGNDAAGHVFKVKVMAEFWPHFNWTHSWGGGMPQFLRYPFLSYIPLALIHRWMGTDIGLLLTGAGVLAIAVSAIGIYLFVWELTRTRSASLISALIYSLTPASWSYAFSGGIYARAFATPFLVLALWAFVRFLKEGNRIVYFLTVVFLAVSFLNHYIVGSIAFLLVFLLGLTLVKELKNKIAIFLKVFPPAVLLTSVFTLPFLSSRPTTKWLGDTSQYAKAVSWGDLFALKQEAVISNTYLNRLSPFLIFLAAVLLILVLFFRARKLFKERVVSRVIILFLILSLLLIVYVRIIFEPFDLLYSIVGIPPGMLHYLSILVAPLVGVLLFVLLPSSKKKLIAYFLLFFIIGLWVKVQLVDVMGSLDLERFYATNAYSTQPFEMIEEIMSNHDEQFNFRFGVEDAGTGGWFNTIFPYIPQTRDYFGQGVVDQDQRFYLINSLFHKSDNYQETNYLMDWWGIKQVMPERTEKVKGKYILNPEHYRLLESAGVRFDILEFTKPSPILVATNSLPILFIGSDDSYQIFFRDFAPANINSRELIPVHGREFVDDYTLGELEGFPSIFLYDYKYRNVIRAEELLKDYVRAGGAIVIEAQTESLRDILPVVSFEKTDFGKSWQLDKTSQGEEFFTETSFSDFGPAVYNDGPWAVYIAKEIKEWGKPILLDAGKPVIVVGDFGQGRVVWSGLNLPYHIDTYKSEEESKLLYKLIFWATKNKTRKEFDFPRKNSSLIYETDTFKTEFIHPEKRILNLKEPAEGILFKEFYYRNWHAYLEKDGRKEKLTIFKAGPEFMYVLLDGVGVGDKVVLQYRHSLFEQASMLISILTLFGLILYLFDWWIFKPYLEKVGQRLISPFKKLTTWWKSEDV